MTISRARLDLFFFHMFGGSFVKVLEIYGNLWESQDIPGCLSPRIAQLALSASTVMVALL